MTPAPGKTRLIVPLVAPDVAAMRRRMSAAASGGADAVECRLDFLQPPPTPAMLQELLAAAPIEVIATCRPARQGGQFAGPESQRLDILRRAAQFAAYVDVELDVAPQDRPGGQIILSTHDFDGRPANLAALVDELERSPAAVNKIAFKAGGPEDALAALDILRRCRKPTFALAMGEPGVASRILAKKFGAFGTFAALDEASQSAPGQPTLRQMKSLYRWDSQTAATTVYGVIGCPIAHSMSPAVHNAAFGQAGLDAVYLPFRVEPDGECFRRFMDELLARPWLDWRGLSVTIPHKEHALAYVGRENCDELAVRIGAINTITIGPGGNLRGDNTDYAAAIDALCAAMGIQRPQLAGRKIAVLGAGGAARAIVAALCSVGAEVTIYNRTPRRGEQLAAEFGASAAPLGAAAGMDAEILINCTPTGMHPHVDASPLEPIPPPVRVVFDTIYNPIQTKLLKQAQARGCTTVSGLEMFVNQAVAQFEIWTGRPAPRDVMRSVVVERLTRTD